MNEALLKIFQDLNLAPQDPKIYQTAFVHRSFLNESKQPLESNERLEFLGDSILSVITSSFIFNLKPDYSEGDLTNLRSYIIKTESLAKASKELGLGRFLQMSKGEELSGGRENLQLLANTYEALLGAIYLDLGLEGASSFVHSTLLPLFIEQLHHGAPRDAKSQLQEVAQNKTKQSPKYRVLRTIGPDHAKKFIVGVYLNGSAIGEGQGTNKQQAEEQAAKNALFRLTQAKI